MRRRRRWVLACVAFLLLAGCAEEEAAPDDTAPSDVPTADSSPTEATPALAIDCAGEGSPTVVFEAGLNTAGDTFDAIAAAVAETTRTCTNDRAGVGASAPLDADEPDPWPGSSADALAEALPEAGEEGPFVVVGWSYGGMVAQAFATRHADVTAVRTGEPMADCDGRFAAAGGRCLD